MPEPEAPAADDEQPAAAPSPEPTPEPTPEPGAEVEPFDPSTIDTIDPSQGVLGLPSPNEWAAITGMSNAIAKSGLCPRDLRNKPDDVALVLLYGRDLRLAPTVALNRISVVEGRPTLDAALMLTLARRAGHRIWPSPENDRTKATANIRLRDDPDQVHSFTFTIEDAAAAGLCKIKDGGRVEARSSSGKVLPWEAYTQFMVWARAVSAIIRMTCPEVTMGVAYIPDELGMTNLDEQGRIIDISPEDYRPASAPAPDPLDEVMGDDTLGRIMDRIGSLTVEQATWAREQWKAPVHWIEGYDPPTNATDEAPGWYLPVPRPGNILRRHLLPIDKLLTAAEAYDPAAAPERPGDGPEAAVAPDAPPDGHEDQADDESHLPCAECFHVNGEHSDRCSMRPFG